MASLTASSIVVASEKQVSSTIEGEAVILHLANGVYYGLNPTGAHVWDFIQDEPRTVADICDAVRAEYDVEDDRCKRDVVRLLSELIEAGLVEVRG